MVMPGRSYSATNEYRYGFNGKENDKDISAGGQDYGMRIYDSRLARFLSVDPIAKQFTYYTPYQFAGNSPIKFIDLDGLEPTEPDQEEYKGKVEMANKAYKKSGGDDKYEYESGDSFAGYKSPTVDKTKFFANTHGFNSNVNTTSQYIFSNEEYYATEKDLVNKLLGDFIYGAGPENWVFPNNGKYSTLLKGSLAVGETLVKWANEDFADGRYDSEAGWRWEVNVRMKGSNISLEHFLGSVATKITTLNDNTIKVEIFNVTSFHSGQISKDLPPWKWFVSQPNSTKRNSENLFSPTYSNTSQYFSFTMSVSEANKLIKQYSNGVAPNKSQ